MVYSRALDCFIGLAMTQYHMPNELTEDEQAYASYVDQFVEKQGAKTEIKLEIDIQAWRMVGKSIQERL